MELIDIVRRQRAPAPWDEVSKIPWDDPDFSTRMLREHLSQDHDAASRRIPTIHAQVDWITNNLLAPKPSNILDLGCGPGLYCLELATRGHHCVGIDFSPASIVYAREQATARQLDVTFTQGDLRSTAFGKDHDLIMLLFGELNTFKPVEVVEFLHRAREALSPGGSFIAEAHSLESIRQRGADGPTWSAREAGLFADKPYVSLNDAHWDQVSQTTVERHYVIDAESADVTLYGTTTRAYTDEEYDALFQEAGFTRLDRHEDWPAPGQAGEFILYLGRP